MRERKWSESNWLTTCHWNTESQAQCRVARRLREIFKDLHLVQAGLATDRLVASWDDTAKQDFSDLCGSIQELRDLIWVNPATDAGLSDWLEMGAEFDDSMTLASFA